MNVGEVDFSRISWAQVLHKSYLFKLENIPVLPVRVFRTLVVKNPDTGGKRDGYSESLCLTFSSLERSFVISSLFLHD